MAKVRHQMELVFEGSALKAIYNQMQDGNWYSLKELAFIANITEAGASARVRDLRKKRYGAHKVTARAGDPWLYRLEV